MVEAWTIMFLLTSTKYMRKDKNIIRLTKHISTVIIRRQWTGWQHSGGYTLHPSATSICPAGQYLPTGSSVSIKSKYKGREPCFQYTYKSTRPPRCLITAVLLPYGSVRMNFPHACSPPVVNDWFSARSETHIPSLCRFKPDQEIQKSNACAFYYFHGNSLPANPQHCKVKARSDGSSNWHVLTC